MKCKLEPAAARPETSAAIMKALAKLIRVVRGNPERLIGEMMADRNYVVSFVNAHAMNLACKDPEFLDALRFSDLLLRDGTGMQILLKMLNREPGLNMNGTDFIPKIVLAGRHHPIALYGSTAPIAAAAAAWFERNGVQRITHCDGFRPLDEYLQLIKLHQPRIVILGMGMPKQELLSALLARQLPGPLLIVNGGAILDFMAHRFKRAPRVLRRLGLEWLFRLLLEPARLWRRYLLGNLVFLWRAAQIVLSGRGSEHLADPP
jgi:exopolysaccharide biosynthesis WecB/TagA/CpsF family protein